MKLPASLEPKDQQDPFWYNNPNNLKNFIFIHSEDFITHFVENEANRQNFTRARYIMLDYQQMRGDQVYDLLMLSDTYKQKAGQLYENGFSMSFYEMLDAYLVSANKLDITLIVLQVPIFLLLGVFIFMVSSQMLNMEQNEIAMIKSRGASRRQIIGIYLLQSSIRRPSAWWAALPLSYLICQVIGSANAFLICSAPRAAGPLLCAGLDFCGCGGGVFGGNHGAAGHSVFEGGHCGTISAAGISRSGRCGRSCFWT